MKLNDVKAYALSPQDIEAWLDKQPDDEVYLINEIAEKLNFPIYSLAKRITKIDDQYSYEAQTNKKFYGNKGAIKKLIDYRNEIMK